MKNKKTFFLILGFACSAGLGAGGTYLANYKKISFMDRYPLILETQDFAEKKLEIGKPENPAEETQINAYLSLYGDKYTRFEPKADIFSKEFIIEETNTSALALGSGLRINFDKNNDLYISEVIPDMPAEKQGLMRGDIIKSIDGEPVTEFKSAKNLRGEDGTTVDLLIERDGKEVRLTFERVCDTIASGGVTYQKYGNTLYLRLDEIGEFMLEPAKRVLSENSFDSLIIDLRNNPGGAISVGMNFADLFIDKARLTQYDKNGEITALSTTDGVEYDVPIAVLVNGKTISAAEMITAFLKQYADTTIIGTKTFGKAIYQQTGFFKGGTLTYTNGYVTVGDWECYHGIGIEPDIEIDMDGDYIGTEQDVQLDEALKLFGEN